MIKWIRARMMSGDPELKKIGHVFQCGSERITFERFCEGTYPPFDCLHLSIDDAVKLRSFLNMAINNHAEKQNKYSEEGVCEHDWTVGFGSIYSPVVYCKLCSAQKPPITDEEFNKLVR